MPDSTEASTDRVRFVRDVAADEDFFGAHERVAEAIATAIHENDDIKVVGIIGRWGSGKSTVVRLLEKALKQKSGRSYNLLCYDAWVHQSDPHRRSFLDQLVSFLEANSLAEKDAWKSEMDVLHRRVEDIDTTTTPALTVAGRLLITSLLLLPLGWAFSGRPWFDAWTKVDASGLDRWVYPLALCIVVLPAALSGLIYAWWRPSWNIFSGPFWKKGNWLKHKAKYEKESILALVSNRQSHRHLTTVTKTPEPSALEFQKVFRKILKSVASFDRRLIIVIDNLDRLGSDDALSMWTTIRSFFLGAIPPDEKLTNSELPTVLLPIDESAIARASGADPNAEDEFARSFMDKTFDAVFHVSPPVLNNWNNYLARQMKFAFGESVPHDWIFETARFYRNRVQSRSEVTPRDINKTVGAIASLWLTWRDGDIPFVSISYFAVFRDVIEGNLVAALNSPSVDISDKDPNWQLSIAALHYGTTPAEAIQVMLDQPLRRAIEAGDDATIKTQMAFPGFDKAIQRLLDDGQYMTINITAKAIIAFAAAGLPESDWAEFAWRRLRAFYSRSDLHTDMGLQSISVAGTLMDHCPAADLAGFLRSVEGRMSAWPPDLYNRPERLDLATGLIGRVCARALAADIKLQGVMIRGDAKAFLELAARLVDEPGIAAAPLRTVATQQLLSAELADLLGDPNRSEFLRTKAEIVLDRGSTKGWDDLVKAASTALAQQPGDGPIVPVAAYILGNLQVDVEAARAALLQNAKNGRLQTILNECAASDLEDGAELAIVLMLIFDQPIAPPNGVAWSSFVGRFAELPSRVDRLVVQWGPKASFRLLINQVAHDSAIAALIAPIVNRRVEDKSLGSLPVESILEDLEKFTVTMAPETKGKFIDRLSIYEGFWEVLRGVGLSDSVIQVISRLVVSDGVMAKTRQQARKELVDLLKAVESARWEQAIRGSAQPLNIAASFQEVAGRSPALGAPLFDALEKLMSDLIANEARPYAVAWFQAAELLSASSRRTLFRNLRDQIIGISAVPKLHDLLNTGGEKLLKDGDFAAKSDEFARHLVLSMMAGEGLPWLLENAGMLKPWIDGASTDTKQVLGDRTRSLIEATEDEGRARLELLSRAWALPSMAT